MIRGGFYNNVQYSVIKDNYPDFKDWVLYGLTQNLLSHDKISWEEPFYPQTDWLLEDRESDQLILDESQIGRFENLKADVKRLLDIDLTQHTNVSTKRNKDWRVYFTNRKVRRKVEKLYQKDFELLGYDYYRPTLEENQELLFKKSTAKIEGAGSTQESRALDNVLVR